ncbi:MULTISPECIES: hypothetical protein [unclassified Psychrobacter]|uniref:hypothetical protein n=1 Tax=unclassified Psychrobacter TaxID=196806 RepID=UPI0025B409FE|nr:MULTISPECIES: hypothetical protein [unclassified Psychrobacter]MDN3454015.1 hypothetical protein [Psychrobacter sp. APC 3350]MDN3501827.1 hypothetical protein [Psychrobacter sp. 5A.1]
MITDNAKLINVEQLMSAKELEVWLSTYQDYQEKEKQLRIVGFTVMAGYGLTQALFNSWQTKELFIGLSLLLLCVLIYPIFMSLKSSTSVNKVIRLLAEEKGLDHKLLRKSFSQYAIDTVGGKGI